MKTPGTFLGFRYDRFIVSRIIFDNGKAVGISSGAEGERDRVVYFKSIRAEDSYIATRPWDNRANKIPGAFDKKKPCKIKSDRSSFKDFFKKFMKGKGQTEDAEEHSYEDLFGYRYTVHRERVKTPAWTKSPLSFDLWLEENKLAKRHELQLQWAYWVLQVDPETTHVDEIKKAYRKLAFKFHPDFGGDNEGMKLVSLAHDIVQRFHDRK